MPEAIADTGPVLHLHEIEHLKALRAAGPLLLPELVVEELGRRAISPSLLEAAGLEIILRSPDGSEEAAAREDAGSTLLQPADLQVFALARRAGFRQLVLTDDLALRRLLESRGATVAGSIGLLVRAYASDRMSRSELEESVEALFHESSLHLSRAFRTYVKDLLRRLP